MQAEATVPLLEHGTVRLVDSRVICEYLEEALPGPSLLPG